MKQGVLEGDLWLRGSGDPRLVIEDLWLLVQRIRGSGVREIRGDLVLDRSAHEPIAHDPAAFDGEALRPYNAGPDALLLNYKAVSFHFVPDAGTRQVRVYALPAIAGMVVPSTVKTAEGACNDWRGARGRRLRGPDAAAVPRTSFRCRAATRSGTSTCSRRCSTRRRSFVPSGRRAAERGAGARATGSRRRTRGASPSTSPARWREVIRDINKFSNNVMARQLFLSIGAESSRQPASMERAQRAVGDWMVSRGLDRREFVLENGAGLSRVERLTSAGLARLLVAAFESPLMPELMSSLPIVGVDGTMRKRSGAAGSAHIKTGLLADTRAIAGYVLAASGQRYAIVAFVNHPNAGATQGALDALLNWVYAQG